MIKAKTNKSRAKSKAFSLPMRDRHFPNQPLVRWYIDLSQRQMVQAEAEEPSDTASALTSS